MSENNAVASERDAAAKANTIDHEIKTGEEKGKKEEAKFESEEKEPETSTPSFPTMYMAPPRFWSIGVENSRLTTEPTSVSLYKENYADKWLLLMSLPGLKEPYGTWSTKKILLAANAFAEINCHIFILSTTPWSTVRRIRTQLETREGRPANSKVYNADNVTFVVDEKPDATIAQKLGVHCKTKCGQKDALCYPSYFLFSPDRQLLQFCVLKDNAKLYVGSEGPFFAYPVTADVMENILSCLKVLKTLHDFVQRAKERLPKAKVTFSELVENLPRLAQNAGEKPLWSILSDVFGGGGAPFGGNLN